MFCLFVGLAAEPRLSVVQKVCHGKDVDNLLPEAAAHYIMTVYLNTRSMLSLQRLSLTNLLWAYSNQGGLV